MRLTAEYTHNELTELLLAAENRLIQVTAVRHNIQRNFGRGHELTVEAGRSVATCTVLLEKLKSDVIKAKLLPAASHGTYEGSPGAQVADEMPLVYGRPRGSKVGQMR